MSKEISATMAIALGLAHDHDGELVRYVGGYWSFRNAPRDHNGHPIDHIGTSTVESLVKRGRLTYSEFKYGRNGNFPIVAKIVTEPRP